MSARSWHAIYERYRPALRIYEQRHKPARAPWWARLIGLLWPALPRRVLAARQAAFRTQSRAAFKKRVHEAKADPEGFKRRYQKI
jgi:hypothetical protein